jgi:putative Holliday junction resolvase
MTDLFTLADLPKGSRIAGLDVGSHTIGVALGDLRHTIASPHSVIRRSKLAADIAALQRIITTQEVAALVVGWPVNMNGSEGPRCQSVRQFTRNIAPAIPLPVRFWDERLSTVAAEQSMLEGDLSRAKRAERIDQTAACVILQGALDHLQYAEGR